MQIKSLDGCKLHGWLIKQPNSLEVNTYIYFHENAGNIGMRMPLLKHMHDEIKCNILIVGYRGYGHSEGKPEEIGIGNDGEAMFKYALTCKDINPD